MEITGTFSISYKHRIGPFPPIGFWIAVLQHAQQMLEQHHWSCPWISQCCMIQIMGTYEIWSPTLANVHCLISVERFVYFGIVCMDEVWWLIFFKWRIPNGVVVWSTCYTTYPTIWQPASWPWHSHSALRPWDSHWDRLHSDSFLRRHSPIVRIRPSPCHRGDGCRIRHRGDSCRIRISVAVGFLTHNIEAVGSVLF